MVLNSLGALQSALGDHRAAAHAFFRAWRLMRHRRFVSELRVEVAGNLAALYLELGRPGRSLKWATRAVWQARQAGRSHRQFASLQLIAAQLALGQTERAARGIARLKGSILPEHASLYWRLCADWAFQKGDRQQAVALAARSLDAAVGDLSAEDIAAAAQTFARYGGCDAVKRQTQRLIAHARACRPWITAFTQACRRLDLPQEKQVVALLVAEDGLILTRAGGGEMLDQLALRGYHAGGRVDEVRQLAEGSGRGPGGRFVPGGGGMVEPHPAVIPGGVAGRWGWARLGGPPGPPGPVRTRDAAGGDAADPGGTAESGGTDPSGYRRKGPANGTTGGHGGVPEATAPGSATPGAATMGPAAPGVSSPGTGASRAATFGAGGPSTTAPGATSRGAAIAGDGPALPAPFAPLTLAGQTSGCTEPPHPAAWVCVWPPQAALARAIATLAVQLHQAAVREQERKEQEEAVAKLTAFHQAAVALGGPLPTPELIARLLALTQQLSRSDGVALLFTERSRGIWADGLDGRILWRTRAVRRVAATGRPGRLSLRRPRDREELGRLGLASLLLVPVFFGEDRCSAVLAAGRLAGPEYAEADLELVTFISRQFGLALENAALRDDLSQRLDALTRDLELARRLQEAFLPAPVLRHGDVQAGGVSLPAKFVGGDLYDYLRLPGGAWGVALGDVMGKGLAAAMLASMFLSRIREIWSCATPGPEAIRRLDLRLAPDLRRARALATLVLGLFDPDSGLLQVWLAGHDGPLLWRGGAWTPLSRGGGTALGLQPGAGTILEAREVLRPGEVALFYSDGLGDLLLGRRGSGRAHDVAAALNRQGFEPQAGRLQEFLRRIRSYAQSCTLQDDVTVVMIGVAHSAARADRRCPDGVLLA
ncbi:PP2C family protein-serine/threonine phosphatase [Thermaerobacter litoralis]